MAAWLSGILLASLSGTVLAVGFRTVASSGAAAQQVFLAPYTNKAIIIDKFHPNYGYPTINLQTGAPNAHEWVYTNSTQPVFGAELDWVTHHLRALHPVDDTSCSIGAFFPDGTLVNVAGAPGSTGSPSIGTGFQHVRSYAPGPCPPTGCTQDWVERGMLNVMRWYPSAHTLTTGDIVVVGGANAGKLVLNEANVNVPSYEIVQQNSTTSLPTVFMPILNFTTQQNTQPFYSYNLYPMLHLLPNPRHANQFFTLAGQRAVIWDYVLNQQIKALPNMPASARTFPASATNVILPLNDLDASPTILVCGGSSNAMPRPAAMSDCWTIQPYSSNPQWVRDDNLPNGGQVMSSGVLLPDGTVLMLNGARLGCAGGHMADDPVLEPLLYNPKAPAGQRFTTLPGTQIPRMYHSVAILLPTGEVLVAGSNTAVTYSARGGVGGTWPYFINNGHRAPIVQQQSNTSFYPTEYRVELFSPPYIGRAQPSFSGNPASFTYGQAFAMKATLNNATIPSNSTVQAVLLHPGFSTHGLGHGQRMINLPTTRTSTGGLTVTAPAGPSVMPPGKYLLWLVVDGTPSVGHWVSLQ